MERINVVPDRGIPPINKIGISLLYSYPLNDFGAFFQTISKKFSELRKNINMLDCKNLDYSFVKKAHFLQFVLCQLTPQFLVLLLHNYSKK